jgi:hypothetical protein
MINTSTPSDLRIRFLVRYALSIYVSHFRSLSLPPSLDPLRSCTFRLTRNDIRQSKVDWRTCNSPSEGSNASMVPHMSWFHMAQSDRGPVWSRKPAYIGMYADASRRRSSRVSDTVVVMVSDDEPIGPSRNHCSAKLRYTSLALLWLIQKLMGPYGHYDPRT